jgi:hypothetical protein
MSSAHRHRILQFVRSCFVKDTKSSVRGRTTVYSVIAATGLVVASTVGFSGGHVGVTAASTVHRAATAVQCHAASCDGKDPVQMGCDKDKQDVQEASASLDTVVLYYSPACHAAWAADTTLPTVRFHNHWVQLWYEAPFGGVAQVHFTLLPISPDAPTLVLTTMANWDDSVKACVDDGADESVDPDVTTDVGFCTLWY